MAGQPPVLLVVDDEPGILALIRKLAERIGYEVDTCSTGQEALNLLRVRRADAALIDLHMPNINGLDVLRAVRQADPQCEAILMTGYASIDAAVEAVKLGAMDYLSKPIDLNRLERLLNTVRAQVDQRQHILVSEADLARRLEFCGMIGRSPIMQDLFARIRRLAPHLRAAVITGEPGTGKELVARALHMVGPRADKPFVAVDCAEAAETDMFGSSGPEGVVAGSIERAEGGVLFLSHVAQLSDSAQVRLLRVLENKELQRVGAEATTPIDVIVLGGTNRDLRTDVVAGRFRGDLLDRLHIVDIVLPPLRERREDIPYLTSAFVREFATRLDKPIRGLTTAAEAMLVAATWDGNVHELRNVIERACRLVDGDFITERELSSSMPIASVRGHQDDDGTGEERDLLSTVEREHILRALQRTGGNKKAAARMLGVSRRALYRRLERLDLGTTISRRKERDGGDRKATA
ncbi:MAG: sigma-54-dependent transcriptional regulator [Vicinamibacterales bacterium]